MCATCGCSATHDGHDHGDGHAHDHGPEHAHDDGPEHAHDHAHGHERTDHARSASRLIQLEHDVLARNDALAARNRRWLADRGVLALNLVSSPGAGKTTLLERTIRDLGAALPIAVIEGDQATARDAARIRAAGARAVQINTGTVCHLDAAMIARALEELDPARGTVVMIENVGNLVCPALFDLGEHAKVVVASVTEGDDKPLKYPHMFRASHTMLLNKIDLAPYVGADLSVMERDARRMRGERPLVFTNLKDGVGVDAVVAWIHTDCLLAPVATAP
jgi:hydrogenase nickel incorporation protein HypB